MQNLFRCATPWGLRLRAALGSLAKIGKASGLEIERRDKHRGVSKWGGAPLGRSRSSFKVQFVLVEEIFHFSFFPIFGQNHKIQVICMGIFLFIFYYF